MVAENYLTRSSLSVSRDVVTILDECVSGVSVPELHTSLAGAGYDLSQNEVEDAIELLVKSNLLHECAGDSDSPPPGIEESISWQSWGPEAQYFHFVTKDAEYLERSDEETAYVTDFLIGDQPALFKRYPDAPRIPLPRCTPLTGKDFTEVLHGRRTVREFAETAVELEQLARVCQQAFAPQRFVDAGELGMLPMRNYANAGARSEFEVYVNVDRITGIERGLYHYCAFDHTLEYLRPAISQEGIDRLTFRQSMCTEAPVVFFVTARVDRVGHKYRHPRALRALYFDAGHLGQTFAMVATANGLGPGQTIAFKDSELEELLDIDGVSESVLYCLTMGVPTAVSVKDVASPPTLDSLARTTLFEDF